MRPQPSWAFLFAGVLVIAALFSYPYWRGVFMGRSAPGAFPNASDAQAEAIRDLERAPYRLDRRVLATVFAAQLTAVPAPTADQPAPNLSDAQAFRRGQFKDLDALRTAKGTVTLYREASGRLLMRFEDFQVSHGLDVQVLLSANETPRLGADLSVPGVSAFIVGPLKGNVGNQNYEIPSELKLERYRSVVLYSEALTLIYAVAPLTR